MTPRLFFTCIGCFLVSGHLSAAEAEPAQPTNMKEVLRARMAEDAKKQAAAPKARPATAAAAAAPTRAATPATATDPAAPPSSTSALASTLPVPVPDAPEKKGVPKGSQEPATVLPKVEVKKGRITVLDQQLAKQEEDIARERKNLKATEVDLALNDTKLAKPLSIFGGDSSQFRQRVASERVQLMEAEKELIAAIAQSKTKAEKQELQKQLDEIRAMRRDLDKSLR